MKRDVRLWALSSDHHHALVLARRARQGADATPELAAQVAAELRAAFDGELARHFAVEERTMLPALERAGEVALVERTLAEHAAMRDCIADESASPNEFLRRFGALLEAHVRFEERELFETCQARLASAELDEVCAAGGGKVEPVR